ncbi:uncharacterized protein LOC129768223 isoform X2 [Toxorhynchites rutilus septentrionalis]|nr:uncharacterized protein LOC129768223 isoform X2 [Toxorhynchites rutilus septentrionalis]
MDIREMRELCFALEQSIQSHQLYQSSAICDEQLPADTLSNLYLSSPDAMRQNNSQQRPIVDTQLFTEFYGYSVTNPVDNFPNAPSISEVPPISASQLESFDIQSIRSPNRRCLFDTENVGRAIGGGYFPDSPGLCCREIHIVQAEVHSLPTADCTIADIKWSNPRVAQRRFESNRKPTAFEWDTIDEYF